MGREGRVIVTRIGCGALIRYLGMIRGRGRGRGRGVLEGESEEVNVFGERGRALLRRVLHELGAGGAPNSVLVPLRKLREASFADGVST